MEMMSESEQGKTWEEEMYWKNFYTMHFYQVLTKDFHDQLVLPSKFAEHMISKLPNKVSLIGPSGSAWNVEVSKTGSLALVGDGWKDFAKAYHLEENFLMLFKYKQNSGFEVLIFDQKSLCEKESSYFVKKCLLEKPNHENSRKRNVSEAASTEVVEFNDGDGGSECAPSKKTKSTSAAEQVIVVERGRNPESPGACPSDASSEDFHNDPDFVVSKRVRHDIIVEVISSGGRKSHQGSKSCLSNDADAKDGGRISKAIVQSKSSIKSKAHSAKKPSDNRAARNLTQCFEMDEMEPIPTDNGENQLIAEDGDRQLTAEVISTGANKCIVYSDALPAKAMNGESPPGKNHSRKARGKKGRAAKLALPKSARKKVFKRATKRFSKEYMSHRRPVTDAEKEDALRRANEAMTKGSFIVVMPPTGVYRRYYLNIPAEWMKKNLPCRHQQVLLRVGDKTWETMFHYYTHRTGSGGLGTGWKYFAVENNLEDADVCLFKPVSEATDVFTILDVKIFRVVEEITPLTPMICSI